LAPTLLSEDVLIVALGVTNITFMAAANTTCQLTSVPEMRGRVMALYGLVFLGSTPIGGPIVGWISQEWGPRYGLAVGGVATVVAGAAMGWVLLRRRIRTEEGPMVVALEPAAAPAAA
jgi:MFS family permease